MSTEKLTDHIKIKQFSKEEIPEPMKSLYVDIDSLFDTRLSVLYLLNRTVAEEEVSSNRYRKRIRDNFGPISADVFRAFYNRRSERVLELAAPTRILEFIKIHFGDVLSDIKNLGMEEELTMYINVHPYDLSIEEMERLEEAFSNQLGENRVKVIKLDYDEISPAWIMQHVGCVFMYDMNKWLEYHSATGELYNIPLVKVQCYAPTILTSSGDNKINKDYFKALQEQMSMIVDYQLVPTDIYSAILF